MVDITSSQVGLQTKRKDYQDVVWVTKTLKQDSFFQTFVKTGDAWSKSAEVQSSVKNLNLAQDPTS